MFAPGRVINDSQQKRGQARSHVVQRQLNARRRSKTALRADNFPWDDVIARFKADMARRYA
jgi:hypothetical protein